MWIDSFSLSADYVPFFSTIQQRPRENDTRPNPLRLRSINPPLILFSNERSRVFEQGKVVCHLPQQLKETADSFGNYNFQNQESEFKDEFLCSYTHVAS